MIKIIKYNIKNKNYEITILSIKGTTVKKDVYLDLQLYFPSFLFYILSKFENVSPGGNFYSFKFIEYSLSIPYRLFSSYSILLRIFKRFRRYNY